MAGCCCLPASVHEYTELYEGFYHSLRINGGTDKVELEMILRDHDRKKLEDRKKPAAAYGGLSEC